MTRQDSQKTVSGLLYLIPALLCLIGFAFMLHFSGQLEKSVGTPQKYFDITDSITVANPLRFALCVEGENMFPRDMFETVGFTFTNTQTGEIIKAEMLRDAEYYEFSSGKFHGMILRQTRFHGLKLAMADIKNPGIYTFALSGNTKSQDSGSFVAREIIPDKTTSRALMIASFAGMLLGLIIPTAVIFRKRNVGLKQRSRRVAITLAILGGLWGLDRFYLGHVGTGLLKFSAFCLPVALRILATFGPMSETTAALYKTASVVAQILLLGLVLVWIRDIVKIANGTIRDSQGNSLR